MGKSLAADASQAGMFLTSYRSIRSGSDQPTSALSINALSEKRKVLCPENDGLRSPTEMVTHRARNSQCGGLSSRGAASKSHRLK
jgi:hypothetical protein